MPQKFETEITVRPHEIDWNRHVNQSVYLDYLLHARVDQMKRCYKMPIESFFKRGYSWITRSISIEYINSVYMEETIIVRTWIETVGKKSVTVKFQMLKKKDLSLATEGTAVFVLINAKTGHPETIPEDIHSKYSI
ncbi:MAG: acyl-CoA thioesterase [Candidatus Aminicenantes bacterium]|nr:acyl-CoA thioesterase [Candidatus Aminicenantes bacterium]